MIQRIKTASSGSEAHRRQWWKWLVLGALGILVVLAPIPFSEVVPTERTIRVEAKSFEYSPGVITVNRGDLVTLELVSSDVVHGIYIDGYDLQMEADPGQTARLTFSADRPGSFRMRCSVTCGALHPFMIGKLRVGDNELLWRGGGLAFLAALVGILLYRAPSAKTSQLSSMVST